VTVTYVDLVDYIAIAAEVTALDVEALMRVAKLDLADSALRTPAGGLAKSSSTRTSSRRPPCLP
jgi:hypothetical protein